MNIKKDEIQCPLCQGKETNFLEKYSIETEDYSLYHCLSCDVQFWHPIKTPGAEWYEKSLLYLGFSTNVGKIGWNHKQFLNDHPAIGGKLLDIGCGPGSFLHHASKLGYNVSGIDFNKRDIEIGKAKFGFINLYSMSLEEFIIDRPNEKFDVVTFFEVLEHLENPVEFISLVKKITKSGGYIALSVPNRDRKIDPLGEGDYPPNHLTRWNNMALKNFLEDNKISIERMLIKKVTSEDIGNLLGQKIRLGLGTKKLLQYQKTGNDQFIKKAGKLYKFKSLIFKMIGISTILPFKLIGLDGTNIYCLGRIK